MGLGSAAASTRPGHVDVDGASRARLPGARGKRPRTGLGLLTRAATLVLTLWPALAVAGDVALLPDVTAHLEGAYYVPSEQAFVWDTWVGAGAGLVRVKRSTFYLTADLETILGRERRPFDANQDRPCETEPSSVSGSALLPRERPVLTRRSAGRGFARAGRSRAA